VNVSTGREHRRAELLAVFDRATLFADALDELAAVVDDAADHSARKAAFVPIWRETATRLRRQAVNVRAEAHRAADRLVDIDAAAQAADRWIPKRGEPCSNDPPAP
jgi:hypothetical protein